MGVRPYLLGRSLAARQIARPDQHGETVFHEFLCDLKTDSLISPGDQSDGFILHSNLFSVDVWRTLPCYAFSSFLTPSD